MLGRINLKFELGVARKKRWKLPLLFVLGLGCSTVSAAVEITDLGTLGGDQSIALSLNDYDQAVGDAHVNGEHHSFLYRNGHMEDINPFSPEDINNVNQVCGGAVAVDGVFYPAIYNTQFGTTTFIGSLAGVTSYGFNGTALAINDSGQAVGYSYLPSGARHAFLYTGGTMLDIGWTGIDSLAYNINNSAQVVGSSFNGAFLYSNGTTTFLHPFGNTESYARGINNLGSVCGEYYAADQNTFKAFIYANGTFTDDFFMPNSPDIAAYEINDAGQVVGCVWVLPKNGTRLSQRERHAYCIKMAI